MGCLTPLQSPSMSTRTPNCSSTERRRTRRRRRTSASISRSRRRRLALIHSARSTTSLRNRVSGPINVDRARGRRYWNSVISDKLKALRNLIPVTGSNREGEGGEIKAEKLFKETANYILLLRMQAFLLQRLVEFYGSTQPSTA
ncbi:hypothetical protein Ancab_005745 [Ancistrocladus abbreviatus]